MYKKILVSFDGSKGSLMALQHAAAMASGLGAELFVVNVIRSAQLEGWSVDPQYRTDRDKLTDKERLSGKGAIAEAKEALKDYHGKAEYILAVGATTQRLLATVEQCKADLIVVGSRGLSGIEKVFLGSVSENIAQMSTIPVLIVK